MDLSNTLNISNTRVLSWLYVCTLGEKVTASKFVEWFEGEGEFMLEAGMETKAGFEAGVEMQAGFEAGAGRSSSL